MAQFLQEVLYRSGRFQTDIIMLATSADDSASVRLLAPGTWRKGVRTLSGDVGGVRYSHVGAMFSEFEFQRYLPRKVLTDLLNQYDLIQIVAGGPSFGLVARDVRPPVCLFVATVVQKERAAIIRQAKGWRKYWLTLMTQVVSKMEKKALMNVSCVFAESEYTMRLVGSKAPLIRLILGLPGIDVARWKPTADYHGRSILLVGRLDDHRKNVRMLLEAYRIILDQVANVPRLVLVGHKGLSVADQAFTDSVGLTDYIDVHTNVDSEKLRELYQNAAIFALSSNEEGLGMVILEAMACGLPVVSTDCGGPSTAVLNDETGFLVPVGGVKAFAERLRILVENPELARNMGRAGRKRAESNFSLTSAGRIYLDEYEKLLNANSQGSLGL